MFVYHILTSISLGAIGTDVWTYYSSSKIEKITPTKKTEAKIELWNVTKGPRPTAMGRPKKKEKRGTI